MRRKPAIALMLAAALMLGTVCVGATETPVVSTTPTVETTPLAEETADVETTTTETATPTPAADITEETTTSDSDVEVTPAAETKDVSATTVVKTVGPVCIQADGNAYVCDENGNRITKAGTPIINGDKYYVAPDGYLRTGWIYLTKWKMYFDPETYVAKVGMSEIDGKMYLFNNNGVMQNYAGTTVIDGKKYWFSLDNASLKTGWLTLGNFQLYFDPETYVAATGVTEIDGKTYLFDSNGVWQSKAGTPIVNGKKYWVQTDGTLGSGWMYLTKWKMYFDPTTYEAKVGLNEINGKMYMFNSNGVMQNYAGTTVIDGKKYWFSLDDASLKTGWLKLTDKWTLYFDPVTYAAITDQIVAIGSNYYHFNEDGIMTTGFQVIGKSYYYFNEDGTMFRNGTKTINGVKMTFGADGICTSSVILSNYSGPYKITVDRTNCVVTIYGDDGSGNFAFPIKAMVCSVGLPETPTPAGSFTTGVQQVKKELMGPSWGQYSTHIVGGIYFHSVSSGDCANYKTTVPVGSYYRLGNPASHGCVRLLVGDAKWIYDNIPKGTLVVIGDNLPMPLGKPSVPTMVVAGVDPTDPNPYG